MEVNVETQGVAYTPGDGSVVWLNDKADSLTVESMTPLQRTIAAARLRAYADLMDADQ